LTWTASRAVWVPVFFYLAETLGVPIVNGAAARPGFWKHAVSVMGVVFVLGSVHLLGRHVWSRSQERSSLDPVNQSDR